MEVYSTFQIKDHYYWTPEAAKPEAKAEPAKPAKPTPTYRSWTVREKDGSTTYYDAQVSSKPVRINGIMI